MASIPVALQLYTVRDDCGRDFIGTLRAVAEAGYRHVEFFDLFGHTADELADVLGDLGLSVPSAHVGLDQLESDLERAMDDYETLGCRELVCPWLDPERRKTPEDFSAVGRILNGVGEKLKLRGFALSYHNHDFEFDQGLKPDGLQRILDNSDPENLSVEPDVYWLAYAGRDPVEAMRKLGPRVRFLHLKDGNLKENTFSPLGRGDLDLPPIVAVGKELGVRAFVVEQDFCDGDAVDSARLSLEYLKSIHADE